MGYLSLVQLFRSPAHLLCQWPVDHRVLTCVTFLQPPATSTSPTAYLEEQEPPETEVEVAEKTVPFPSIGSASLTVPSQEQSKRRKSLPFNARLLSKASELHLGKLPTVLRTPVMSKLKRLRTSEGSPQPPVIPDDRFPSHALTVRKARAMSVFSTGGAMVISLQKEHILQQKKKFEQVQNYLSSSEEGSPLKDGGLQGAISSPVELGSGKSSRSPIKEEQSRSPPKEADIISVQCQVTEVVNVEYGTEQPLSLPHSTGVSTPSLSPRPESAEGGKVKRKKRRTPRLLHLPSCLKSGRRLSND